MKLGTDIMLLEATSSMYFPISYHQ